MCFQVSVIHQCKAQIGSVYNEKCKVAGYKVMCRQQYSHYKKCSEDSQLLCFTYKFIYFDTQNV